MPSPLRCALDESRLDPVRTCLTDFLAPRSGRGVAVPKASPWSNTGLARDAVAFSCGAMRRRGAVVEHEHDAEEWASCRRLAKEASLLMDEVEVGMGSSGEAYFSPFFVVAERGTARPASLDERGIREAFGGTIYPPLTIVVEPLEEHGTWWDKVREYLVDNDDAREDPETMAEGRSELRRWQAMAAWFRGRKEFVGSWFVMMESPRRPGSDPSWSGCTFPYLAVGLTSAGSLAGVWGPYVDR